MIDQNELRKLANEAFGQAVDCDFAGNTITNYDVLLSGAFGPAVMRLVNLAVERYAATPAPTAPSALEKFKECMSDEVETPLERLRLFCSLAMLGQDWLDVEQFFDALEAQLATPTAPSDEKDAIIADLTRKHATVVEICRDNRKVIAELREQLAAPAFKVCPKCMGRGQRDIAHGVTEPCEPCEGKGVVAAPAPTAPALSDAQDAARYRHIVTTMATYGVPFNPPEQYGIEFSPLPLVVPVGQDKFWTAEPSKEEIDAAIDADMRTE